MADQTQASATTTAAAPAELPMEEYAAARARGENPAQAKPAAATEIDVKAAATEEIDPAAAATVTTEDDGKTTTESATEDDPEKQIEESHPAKKGISKRFSEMTAKQKELQALADQRATEVEAAKREAAEAKAEADRLKAEAAEAAKAAIPVVPKVEDDPAPSRDAFDDPDEYVAALSAHTARSELRKANVAAQEAAAARQKEADQAANAARQAQVQAQITKLHGDFQARVTEVKPEYPDYDEKVTNNESLVLRNDVFFTIETSKEAPHLLYHLATNPDVAAELNGMSQQEAAMRLGELQAELRIARKPKVTKAAEPIKPVGSRQSPQPKTPNEESMEEYAERRDREMKEEAARKFPKRAGNR